MLLKKKAFLKLDKNIKAFLSYLFANKIKY